jgi:hypothetical protein
MLFTYRLFVIALTGVPENEAQLEAVLLCHLQHVNGWTDDGAMTFWSEIALNKDSKTWNRTCFLTRQLTVPHPFREED